MVKFRRNFWYQAGEERSLSLFLNKERYLLRKSVMVVMFRALVENVSGL